MYFRSASLPRNYGSRGPGERVSMMAAMMRTPGSGTAGTMTRPSNLALKTNSAGSWKAKVLFSIKIYLCFQTVFIF